MRNISFIVSIILSGIWIILHAIGFFKYDLASILFPCLWFIVVSYGFGDLVESKKKLIKEKRRLRGKKNGKEHLL